MTRPLWANLKIQTWCSGPKKGGLENFFLGKLKNQQGCTSTRDLIKDAPLIERKEREEKKAQLPSNPEPLEPLSDELQLELPPGPWKSADVASFLLSCRVASHFRPGTSTSARTTPSSWRLSRRSSSTSSSCCSGTRTRRTRRTWTRRTSGRSRSRSTTWSSSRLRSRTWRRRCRSDARSRRCTTTSPSRRSTTSLTSSTGRPTLKTLSGWDPHLYVALTLKTC